MDFSVGFSDGLTGRALSGRVLGSGYNISQNMGIYLGIVLTCILYLACLFLYLKQSQL